MLNKNNFTENDVADNGSQKIVNFVDNDGNVFILGEFDSTISQNVVPGLAKKIRDEANKPDGQIWFYINSNGGYCSELYNLLSLIDLAKSLGIKIFTVNMGRAYSCGSMLAIHGDHRAMYKYARHLLHLGQQGDEVTTFEQISRTHKRWNEHFDNIVRMYKDNTKMEEKEIREILKDDGYFMNAEECKKYGLVDEIIGEKKLPQVIEVSDGDTVSLDGMPVIIRLKQAKPKKTTKTTKTKKKK
jgi:ATP-dependent Clp protease protease subunit